MVTFSPLCNKSSTLLPVDGELRKLTDATIVPVLELEDVELTEEPPEGITLRAVL
jgi:hypothetical protein